MSDIVTRIRAWANAIRNPPRVDGEPPPPSSYNCDVLCVLPDGQRGYFDGVCLWTSTGTTIHSPDDAYAHAHDLRREYGHRAKFFAVDADYSEPWLPICDIDGNPVTLTECGACGYGAPSNIVVGGLCRSCQQDAANVDE